MDGTQQEVMCTQPRAVIDKICNANLKLEQLVERPPKLLEDDAGAVLAVELDKVVDGDGLEDGAVIERLLTDLEISAEEDEGHGGDLAGVVEVDARAFHLEVVHHPRVDKVHFLGVDRLGVGVDFPLLGLVYNDVMSFQFYRSIIYLYHSQG